MAIQTSTIVMAVVACVPFGFAIHDTVTGGDRRASYDDDEDEELRRYSARESEAELEVERMEAEARSRRARLRGSLIGAQPASLGAAFPRLVLGTREQDLPGLAISALRRLERTADADIELESAPTLSLVRITPKRYASETETDQLCEDLLAAIEAAGWGEATELEDEDLESVRQWTDPTAGQRATLSRSSGDTCKLEFEQAVAASTWFDRTSAASIVPVWAIGQPTNRLDEMLDGRGSTEDLGDSVEVSWSGAALGHGIGRTSLTATLVGGKVRRVVAEVNLTGTTRQELVGHLTALFGEPTTSDGETLVWPKARPPVQLATEGDATVATVGQQE